MRRAKDFVKNIFYLIKMCAKECPQMIIADSAFGIVVAMQSLLLILLPKIILDALIYEKNAGKALAFIIILGVGEALAGYVQTFIADISGVYNEKVAHDLLLNLSRKATDINLGAMKRYEVIEKYQQAQNVTFGLENKVAVLFCDFFSNIIKFVTIFAVVSAVSGWMALVIIVLVFAKMFILDKANEKDMALRMQDNRENVHYGYITELCEKLNFAKEVRTYGLQGFVFKKFEKSKNAKLSIAKERNTVAVESSIYENVMDTLMLAAAYAAIIIRYLKNAVSISAFSVYLTAVSEAYYTISQIMRVGVLLKDTNRQVEQFVEFMKYPEQAAGNIKVEDILDSGKIKTVEFKNVSFKYPGTDNYVLKDVNVKFNGGEKIGIVGENGAGKSTFVNLLLRFYDIEEGEILVNGINAKEYDYEEYMKLFSVVPQNYALFFFSIYENITFGRDNEKRFNDSLEKVDMLKKVESLPWKKDCYMSKWFTKGMDFSGGERQRFAIARSFFNDSPIMIMDEPNSAIDPLAEKKINDSVKDISDEKLVINISHRLSLTKNCDKILVFDKGRIAENGTHDELIRAGGLYKEAFYTQAKNYIS